MDSENLNQINLDSSGNQSTAYHKKKTGKGVLFWLAIGFGSFFLMGCFSLLLFAGIFFSIARTFSPDEASFGKNRLTEVVVSGTEKDKILLVPIKGIISDKSVEGVFFSTQGIVEMVKLSLDQATSDDFVRAVIFEVDSPGGGITASDIIYNNIVNFKNKTGKSVIVYMQDVAASGGYYVSVAADKIIAHPTTITGSIGVIMPMINVAGLIGKYGIEDKSIKSGLMKDIGSPLKHMLPAEENVLSEIVMEMYMRFVTIIANERKLPIDYIKSLADGRIFTGRQALENGLIDQVGYLDDAIKLTKDIVGLEKASIIRYQKKFGFGDIFKVMVSRVFANPEITIKLDEFSREHLSKPMYLWSGY